MLPPALEGFFPANALTGTDKLVVIPVVGRDILVARGSRDLVIDREQADVMKFFCQQRWGSGMASTARSGTCPQSAVPWRASQ